MAASENMYAATPQHLVNSHGRVTAIMWHMACKLYASLGHLKPALLAEASSAYECWVLMSRAATKKLKWLSAMLAVLQALPKRFKHDAVVIAIRTPSTHANSSTMHRTAEARTWLQCSHYMCAAHCCQLLEVLQFASKHASTHADTQMFVCRCILLKV
jgi:hypothetical protein